MIQQVKKFTSCLLYTVKKNPTNTYFGDPPKYMVVKRELKVIFLCTSTCPQCRTGYNFMCNLFFHKIWILTPLMWNCPIMNLTKSMYLPFSKPELPRNITITPTVTIYLPGRKNKLHNGKTRARRHLTHNTLKKKAL